jgi:hypothetical protein
MPNKKIYKWELLIHNAALSKIVEHSIGIIPTNIIGSNDINEDI